MIPNQLIELTRVGNAPESSRPVSLQESFNGRDARQIIDPLALHQLDIANRPRPPCRIVILMPVRPCPIA